MQLPARKATSIGEMLRPYAGVITDVRALLLLGKRRCAVYAMPTCKCYGIMSKLSLVALVRHRRTPPPSMHLHMASHGMSTHTHTHTQRAKHENRHTA